MGCSKEESTSSSSSESSSTTQSTTEANLNVVDIDSNPKAGYTVMMFLEKPSLNEPLPEIQMQVISNAEGLARFDLKDYITGPTTLYFEAFTVDGNNYIWESVTHPVKTIDVGTKWTTSIIVD